MNYLNKESNEIKNWMEVKSLFNNISFGIVPSDTIGKDWVKLIEIELDTEYDNNTHKAVLSEPIIEGDLYKQVWKVIPLGVVELLKVTSNLRYQKGIDIRKTFNDSLSDNITTNISSWYSGEESAMKMDGAVRISEMTGNNEVTLTDINRTPHTMPLEHAYDIIKTVGTDYQGKFMRKQAALKAVADLPETAVKADFEAIVF